MKWIKYKVSLAFRIRSIIRGIDWLITVYLPFRYNGEWFVTKTTILDRINCFTACIDTAIRGYVYRLKED